MLHLTFLAQLLLLYLLEGCDNKHTSSPGVNEERQSGPIIPAALAFPLWWPIAVLKNRQKLHGPSNTDI